MIPAACICKLTDSPVKWESSFNMTILYVVLVVSQYYRGSTVLNKIIIFKLDYMYYFHSLLHLILMCLHMLWMYVILLHNRLWVRRSVEASSRQSPSSSVGVSSIHAYQAHTNTSKVTASYRSQQTFAYVIWWSFLVASPPSSVIFSMYVQHWNAENRAWEWGYIFIILCASFLGVIRTNEHKISLNASSYITIY